MLQNIFQCTGQSLMSIVPILSKCELEEPKAQGHSYQKKSRGVCPATAEITEEKITMA